MSVFPGRVAARHHSDDLGLPGSVTVHLELSTTGTSPLGLARGPSESLSLHEVETSGLHPRLIGFSSCSCQGLPEPCGCGEQAPASQIGGPPSSG